MSTPTNQWSIGIDLGGTSLRVGLFDSELNRIDSHRISTRVADGPEAVIGDMAGCIRKLLGAASARISLSGIGIGSPGPLNLQTGMLGLLPNFPGWDGFPLRDCLVEATGLPVYLECDSNAAAIAEWKLGAGRTAQVDSLAMITLGTGVGSGIILQGRIWHGMVGMGGEVGHISVDRDGPECPCGSRGCLELYASAAGLVRLARDQANTPSASMALKRLAERPDGFSAFELAQLSQGGDVSASRAFERLGEHLGFALAGLVNKLEIPQIHIGGGVAGGWNFFATAMLDAVQQYSIVYRLQEPTQRITQEIGRHFIGAAELGPDAGLLGAALLPYLLESNGLTEVSGRNICTSRIA